MVTNNRLSLSYLWQGLLFFVLLIISFSCFAVVYFQGINSDMAIQVLMADRFKGFEDLYYWGQNRLGSIIPALAKPLTYLMHPLWAVSVVQYLFIAGTAAWIFFWIKQPLWRFICLLFLLLPVDIWYFQLAVGHPYSAQTFLIISAFSLLSISHPKPALAAFCLGLAVWVSEVSLAGVPVFIYLFYKRFPFAIKDLLRPIFYRKQIPVILAILAVSWLILKAKLHATGDPAYNTAPLANVTEIRHNIVTLFTNYLGMFKYHPDRPWNLLARCLSLTIPGVFLYMTALFFGRKNRENYPPAFALVLFCWGTLAILCLSSYFFKSGSSDRYMSNVPLMALFAVSVFLQNKVGAFVKTVGVLTLMGVLISSASSFDRFRLKEFHRWDGELPLSTVKDFPIEPNSAIIGTYWNSYIFSAFYTREVTTTPYWGELIRDWPAFHKALDGRPVYAIGKGWMEDFADTISMGPDYRLIKNSEVKTFRDAHYCIYRTEKKPKE